MTPITRRAGSRWAARRVSSASRGATPWRRMPTSTARWTSTGRPLRSEASRTRRRSAGSWIVTAARAVETDYGVLAQDGHMSVEGLCELWESFD